MKWYKDTEGGIRFETGVRFLPVEIGRRVFGQRQEGELRVEDKPFFGGHKFWVQRRSSVLSVARFEGIEYVGAWPRSWPGCNVWIGPCRKPWTIEKWVRRNSADGCLMTWDDYHMLGREECNALGMDRKVMLGVLHVAIQFTAGWTHVKIESKSVMPHDRRLWINGKSMSLGVHQDFMELCCLKDGETGERWLKVEVVS